MMEGAVKLVCVSALSVRAAAMGVCAGERRMLWSVGG